MDLLTLDDPPAADVGRFGGKAGRLAAARQRGLPILPGLIVPPEALGALLEAGAWAFEQGSAHAARAAIWRIGLDRAAVAQLTASGAMPARAIVRPSTSFDDEPGWAGAFSTVHGVAPPEIPNAVIACTASAFAPQTLARFEQAQRSPRAFRISVLIQPELDVPASGGWARVQGNDVHIRAVAGSPAPLLSGTTRGAALSVANDGMVTGSLPAPLDEEAAVAIADLARRVSFELGCEAIEWLVADDRPVLLQALRGQRLASPASRFDFPDGALVGVPASPGTATGTLRMVRAAESIGAVRGGDVLVVDQPLAWYAPLLWNAAALVSRDGDPAAHLFEVARSLRVPAVAQVDLPSEAGTDVDPIVAVDGTAGWVLPRTEA